MMLYNISKSPGPYDNFAIVQTSEFGVTLLTGTCDKSGNAKAKSGFAFTPEFAREFAARMVRAAEVIEKMRAEQGAGEMVAQAGGEAIDG